MMIIDNKYEIGQIVYLKTDETQAPRMITAITIRQGIMYELSCGTLASLHYDFEVTTEENTLVKVK